MCPFLNGPRIWVNRLISALISALFPCIVPLYRIVRGMVVAAGVTIMGRKQVSSVMEVGTFRVAVTVSTPEIAAPLIWVFGVVFQVLIRWMRTRSWVFVD